MADAMVPELDHLTEARLAGAEGPPASSIAAAEASYAYRTSGRGVGGDIMCNRRPQMG